MGNVGSCGAGYKLSQPNWPAFCVPCTNPGEYCPEVLLPTFKPSGPGANCCAGRCFYGLTLFCTGHLTLTTGITPLCSVGFALVENQCVPAREACIQSCADGSAPGGSGLRGIWYALLSMTETPCSPHCDPCYLSTCSNGQNAGDKCYYDLVSGGQYQGKDYVSSVGCPTACGPLIPLTFQRFRH